MLGALLILGDCVEAMASLDAESIDAVVCDPPYGIEFMGKDWDRFIPDSVEMHPRDAFRNPHACGDETDWRSVPAYAGASPDVLAFGEFSKRWAEAAYRVLKPGGHLLAFGGPRMYHRLTCGIEDAGFEIRDSLHWIYGCLSDDTEILTADGWRLGTSVARGARVASWDPATGEVALADVEETFAAPYAGPMRVLRNADTDQLLTPNHRVYHRTSYRKQRDGVRRAYWPEQWEVAEAQDVTRYRPTRLPTAGFADGQGIGGCDYAELLAFVWTEGSLDRNGSGVRIYQSPSANPDTSRRIARIVARLAPGAKRYDRERVYKSRTAGPVLSAESCWFFTGETAMRVRADLPEKQPTYDLLWRMTLAEKVAFLDAAMAGDGSGNAFEQKGRAPLEWFQTLAHLSGWSARVRMRTGRTTGACSLRRNATTEMQSRHFGAAYDAYYDGIVWCVRVPTGAFVARRNGRVFITGNSGFPKSLNVALAIDKAAGCDRDVVGERPQKVSTGSGRYNWNTAPEGTGRGETFQETAATSEDAKRWDGWGTALKPAHEPIVLARKPLSGTVVETVLAHGTGALNVGGCEIGTSGGVVTVPGSRAVNPNGVTDFPGRGVTEPAGGRWPANVLLAHLPECKGSGPHHTETLCAPGCPVAELNEASGESSSSSLMPLPTVPGFAGDRFGDGGNTSRSSVRGHNDQGGAARFFYIAKPRTRERVGGTIRNLHPTVKPIDLMRHLVRLVTPPGGLVLDPFLGSGTTGCAAMVEGFRFVGVERDEESFDTSLARISDYAFAHGRDRPTVRRPD